MFSMTILVCVAVFHIGCAANKETSDPSVPDIHSIWAQTQYNQANIEEVRYELEQITQANGEKTSEIEKIGEKLENIEKNIGMIQYGSETPSQTHEAETIEPFEAVDDTADRGFLYEITLSDDAVKFGLNKHRLTEKAKTILDEFAAEVIAINKNIFLEIQGHTDDIGGYEYNVELGLARAEAVRQYLYRKHGFPLQRMFTYSYGESKPLVPNTSPENRSKNRRVVIVVMK